MFEIYILKTTPETSSTKSCFVLFSKQSSENLDMVQSRWRVVIGQCYDN